MEGVTMKARKTIAQTIALTRIARDGEVRRLVASLERGRPGKDALEQDVWPQHFAAKGKVPPP